MFRVTSAISHKKMEIQSWISDGGQAKYLWRKFEMAKNLHMRFKNVLFQESQ